MQRPLSALPLDALVEAARIVTAYPGIPGIQKYKTHVVALRLTPDEYLELVDQRALIRTAEIIHAPAALHAS